MPTGFTSIIVARSYFLASLAGTSLPFTVSGAHSPLNREKSQDNTGISWFITRW
jgi:hypothetical protein